MKTVIFDVKIANGLVRKELLKVVKNVQHRKVGIELITECLEKLIVEFVDFGDFCEQTTPIIER